MLVLATKCFGLFLSIFGFIFVILDKDASWLCDLTKNKAFSKYKMYRLKIELP